MAIISPMHILPGSTHMFRIASHSIPSTLEKCMAGTFSLGFSSSR